MIRHSSSFPNGRWDWVVEGDTVKQFNHAMFGDGNGEDAVKGALTMLNEIRTVFTDGRVLKRIDNLIKAFNAVEDMEDHTHINKLANKLYDFCDQWNIFIGWDW